MNDRLAALEAEVRAMRATIERLAPRDAGPGAP